LSNIGWDNRHLAAKLKLSAMNEFVLIVRLDVLPEVRFSPDELKPMMNVWENWIDSIIDQNILVARGNRLGADGRTIKNGNIITNGPYAEIKEIIGGYFIIRANSIDEAAEIAKDAPLIGNGNIEVRNIYSSND
jgi:hypothetical protein